MNSWVPEMGVAVLSSLTQKSTASLKIDLTVPIRRTQARPLESFAERPCTGRWDKYHISGYLSFLLSISAHMVSCFSRCRYRRAQIVH